MSPERIDPGRTDFTIRNTPKVVGGITRALHREGDGGVPRVLRRAGAGVVARRGRALQAAREHLPLGQHRVHQRDGDHVRPHGDRHLGGRRGGLHEAVRVHEVPARPRPRRPLPAARPVLPRLAGARVRLLHRVHRARGQGQREHAVLLRDQDRAGPERRAAQRPGLAACWCSGWPTRPNIDDVRESPAEKIIALLEADGAMVSYHDPHVARARRDALRAARRRRR